MKKQLKKWLIPLVIADIFLLPSILFSLSPVELENIFQLSFVKPFVIIGEFTQIAVFYLLKPVVWAILFTIYYLFALVIHKKEFKLKSLSALTVLYLINLYGNISAYTLIDALYGI